MRKKVKASLLLLLGYLLTFCLCLICGVSLLKPPITVSANTNVMLKMEDGAQVRLLTPTGLRFTASISKDDYSEVIDAGGTFGMFLLPNEYRKTVGEINEANTFGDEAKYCWESAESGKTQIIHCATNTLSQKSGNTYYFACALTNLYEDNYETEFFARAYVEIAGARVWAELNETNVRSVSYVSQKVLSYESAGEYTPSEQAKSTLVEYVTQFSKVNETAGETALENNQVGLLVADIENVCAVEIDGNEVDFTYSVNGKELVISSVSKGRHTAKITLDDDSNSTWEIPFVYADYIINTVEDIESWITARNAFTGAERIYAVVTHDIVFTKTTGISGIPTGTPLMEGCTFDGYGHILKGFILTSGWGIIGGLSGNSVVRDLALIDVRLTGTAYCALYTEAYGNARIENVFISGANVTTQYTQFMMGGSITRPSLSSSSYIEDCVVIDYSNLTGKSGAEKGALGRIQIPDTSFKTTVDGNVFVTDGTVLFDNTNNKDVFSGDYTNRNNYVRGENTVLSHGNKAGMISALKSLDGRSDAWSFDETTDTLYLRGNRIYEVNEEKQEYTDGVHDYTATETENYLVQNGETEYQLVLPRFENELTFAKEEFIFFFKEATGIEISVTNEPPAGLTHSATAKYISLGNTKLLKSAGLAADESVLGSQGARIVTKDNTIYLFGGEENGALYAVYDFMSLVFHYEIYYYDVWEIDHVEEVKLMSFDVTNVPDVEIRSPSFGGVRQNVDNLGYRFRQPLLYNDYFLPVGDVEHGQLRAGIHNTDNILPKSYWGETHPKWFADAPVTNYPQLCYTAHGDKTEYEAMVAQIVKVMVDSLKSYSKINYPDYKFIGLMGEDENTVCSCEACTSAFKRYGSHTGAIIVMCNEVMERVQAEMSKTENRSYYREDLKLLFFAYNQFLTPPARYNNTTDTWIPTIQMRNDVGVFYAKNKNVNYRLDVYSWANSTLRDEVEAWGAVSNGNICLWTYSTNFYCYMVFNDTFGHFTSEGYQYYISNGTTMFINQGESSQKDSDNFDGLKAYLDSKLQWDCTLDTEELTNAWFNAMYGEASEKMKELFSEHQAASYYAYNLKGWYYGNIHNANLISSEFWPYETLNGMLETCNEAHRIAFNTYARTDFEKYKKIKRNIDLEWLSITALMLKFYGTSGELTAERYTKITDYFFGLKDTVYAMNWAEGVRYSALWAENETYLSVFDSLEYILGYVYPETPEKDWEEEFLETLRKEQFFLTAVGFIDNCTADDIY